MAIKRTKRNIKKTAKPVAPKENVVKREKTKKPKTQKPLEKKAPPKASQPKPKQPKRDYNREYSNSFEVVRGSRLIKFKRRIISYGIIAAIMFSIQEDTVVSSIIAAAAALLSIVCIFFAFLSWKEKHNQDL